MEKTRHQIFVEQLHKQMGSGLVHRTDPTTKRCADSNDDESKEDLMKELERKFDELFGAFDDDSTGSEE